MLTSPPPPIAPKVDQSPPDEAKNKDKEQVYAMFDIGFGDLMLVFIIGLVVLGPERLPVAVRTVAVWIRVIRSMASTVQNELTQELKLQELQDSLKKVEKASKNNLSPELKASIFAGD